MNIRTNFTESFWHQYLQRPYRLHVTDQGPRDKPVILMLHGIAASSATWDDVIPLLVNDFRCITIDLAGFGQSPKPQWYDYTMEDHLRCIRRTIKSLHLRGDFVLAGHSLGSLLATRYTSVWPKHISRVLLLSPPIYAPLDASLGGPITKTRNNILLKIYKFLRSHPSMTPENFKRLSYILPLPKSVVRHPETWLPFRRSLEHCIEQQTIAQDITEISVPIDLFYGTLDQVVIPYNIRQITNDARVQIHSISGANHDVGKRYARTVAASIIPYR